MSITPGEDPKELAFIAQSDKIIRDSIDYVEEQLKKSPSYYDLIPQAYREGVDKLVRGNLEHYRTQFKDENAFREAMSKNWLMKWYAFGKVAETAGYYRVIDASQETQALNEKMYAMMTQSASYVFVGPGSRDTKNVGAAYVYRRLPLREGEKFRAHDKTMTEGAFLPIPPREGERLIVMGRNQPIQNTTPLISLYMKAGISNGKTDLQLESRVKQTFRTIDVKTLH